MLPSDRLVGVYLGRVEGHQRLRKQGTGSILPILATATARSAVIMFTVNVTYTLLLLAYTNSEVKFWFP